MNIESIIKEIKNNSKKRKFDESITAHYFFIPKKNQANTGIIIKGFVSFPNAFGKEKKIVVFTDDVSISNQVKELGVYKVGGQELIDEIYDRKNVDFDVVITTPNMMSKIARISKILGPKGLMPNPKNSTVGENIFDLVKMYKSCSQTYKSENNNVINIVFGKLSMDDTKLIKNFNHVTEVILSECKKYGINAFKRVIIKSTMGKPYTL